MQKVEDDIFSFKKKSSSGDSVSRDRCWVGDILWDFEQLGVRCGLLG